ncbi:hypothetical protein BX600DRAFT_496224 [Xylariales sp. PMI_506]|nr:hypothetical protein BX600DRAFT_496224 [Xylariales sp. PMI_506]
MSSAAKPSAAPNKPGGSASVSRPPKHQRVLACLLCQKRKIKCDRQFPCTQCIKSRAQCVPATLMPRRRRRRFAERDLLDHIRKCEDLLRQNSIKFDPLHKDPSAEAPSTHTTEDGSDSDDDQPEIVEHEPPPRAKLSNSGFVKKTKDFWNNVQHAFAEATYDLDSDSNGEYREKAVRKMWDHMFDNNDHLLFGSRKTVVDLSTLHPGAVQIFKLWQIYLNNVNPLFKISHTSSLQSRIIDAAGNLESVNPNLEALMFSMYSMAVLSLEPEECEAQLGTSRDTLLTGYGFACNQALLNADFLRTSNRDCLTALFLYLVSVRPKTDPRALSSMVGVVIRIAHRMGIHSESKNQRYPPFEAEMRRRLWWAILLFDARINEFIDGRGSMLTPVWDCKTPLNVDDSELRVDMKELPTDQEKPSEALFISMRSGIGDFIRHASFHLDGLNPALTTLAKVIRSSSESGTGAQKTDTLEAVVEKKYIKYCNPDNPVHYMTIWTARSFLAKYRLMEYYEGHSLQTDDELDTMNVLAMRTMEYDTKLMSSPLIKGFHWYTHFYFPFPAHIQVVMDLRRRPTSAHAVQAWKAMGDNYFARQDFLGGPKSPFFGMFAGLVLQAWEAHQAALKEQEQVGTVPEIVSDIRDRLAGQAANAISESVGDDPEPPAGFHTDLQTSMLTGFGDPAFLDRVMTLDNYAAFPSLGYTPIPPTHPSVNFAAAQQNWAAPPHWGMPGSSSDQRHF